MRTNWKWAVLDENGVETVESDDLAFSMLDQSKIKHLIVFDEDNPTRQYAVTIAGGMRPIFFRRQRHLQVNDPEHVPIEYLVDGEFTDNITFATVLGWQSTVKGTNVKSLIWLMYDDSVAITDRDIDDLVEA